MFMLNHPRRILTIPERKLIGSCFYPAIYYQGDLQSAYEQLERANRIERAVRSMLNGNVTAWEMVEQFEDAFGDDFTVDEYLDEVEAELEIIELICPQIF